MPIHRSVGLPAVLAGLVVLTSGCGSGTRPATVSCPTFDEVEKMSPAELNAIPKACDENLPIPSDQPGVSSSR